MRYEEKVSTRADVRALYEKVINDPQIEKYRGYTESKSYAWDALSGDVIKRDGEVWFDNPSYCEELPEEELLDENCAMEAVFSDTEEEGEDARVEELEMQLAEAIAARDEARDALFELRDALALVRKVAAAE